MTGPKPPQPLTPTTVLSVTDVSRIVCCSPNLVRRWTGTMGLKHKVKPITHRLQINPFDLIQFLEQHDPNATLPMVLQRLKTEMVVK